MSSFDPYHKWLGIPKVEQPPHHYRLLGVAPFESDLEVIEAAADRQMSYIRQCATGPYTKESQQILNELSAARICLLNPEKKQAYDGDLKSRLAPAPPEPRAPVSRPRVTRIPADRPLADESDGEDYSLMVLQKSVVEEGLVLPRRRRSTRSTRSRPYPLWGAAGGIALLVLWGIVHLVSSSGSDSNQPAGNAEVTGNQTALAAPRTAPRPLQKHPSARTEGLAAGEELVVRMDAAVGQSPPDDAAAGREAPAADEEVPNEDSAVEDAKVPVADNLLKRITPDRNSVRGTWRFDGKTLVSPATDFALLQIPVTPPAEGYILRASVEADRIQDCLSLGLVTGSTQVTVVCNGWSGTTSGLQVVDFQMVPFNETRTGPVLLAGRPNEIVCIVARGRVEVKCNGKPIVNWSGDFSRLLAGPDWEPPDKRQLFLGTHQTSFRISRLELEPLAKSGRVSRRSPANQKRPK